MTKVFENEFWVYYLNEYLLYLDEAKSGKWMYFFSDRGFVESICRRAVDEGVVAECKHSNAGDGVACFYLNDDDLEGHKRVIKFFIDNNLIRRTKAGRLYNISFKRDRQTLSGEYGNDYSSDIKLSDFVSLQTGEFI